MEGGPVMATRACSGLAGQEEEGNSETGPGSMPAHGGLQSLDNPLIQSSTIS